MNTLLLSQDNPQAIDQATALLAQGEVVAIPTETVYGLAADATNLTAVKKIYQVKQRPEGHPLIMHFSTYEQIQPWIQDEPEALQRLAQALWPGPLSVLVKRSDKVLSEITGGSDKVCIRIPNHALTRQVIQQLGKPIVAPSANLFGRVSPTHAAHVMADLQGKIAAVLDGGECDVGLESTIIDLTTQPPTLLRPGGYSVAEIEQVLGCKLALQDQGNTKVSGNLLNHYQPNTKLIALSLAQIHDMQAQQKFASNSTLIHHSPIAGLNIKTVQMAHEPKAYGKALYAVLRELDQQGLSTIYIETPPTSLDWLAPLDRVGKAVYKD